MALDEELRRNMALQEEEENRRKMMASMEAMKASQEARMAATAAEGDAPMTSRDAPMTSRDAPMTSRDALMVPPTPMTTQAPMAQDVGKVESDSSSDEDPMGSDEDPMASDDEEEDVKLSYEEDPMDVPPMAPTKDDANKVASDNGTREEVGPTKESVSEADMQNRQSPTHVFMTKEGGVKMSLPEDIMPLLKELGLEAVIVNEGWILIRRKTYIDFFIEDQPYNSVEVFLHSVTTVRGPFNSVIPNCHFLMDCNFPANDNSHLGPDGAQPEAERPHLHHGGAEDGLLDAALLRHRHPRQHQRHAGPRWAGGARG